MHKLNRLPRLPPRGLFLVLMLGAGGMHAQPAPDTAAKTSSYMPVKIEEPFDLIQRGMEQARPGITQSHQEFLAERYDLANRPADGVTMTRGKAVQQGARARLKSGLTWEMLAALTPDEIRARGIFPAGFMPLPHPNHPEGGMVFPHFVTDELKRQELFDCVDRVGAVL